MTRPAFSLEVRDLSAFARQLRAQLSDVGPAPGHLDLLNMLCRASGFRNFQHFRADQEASRRLEAAAAPPPPIDHVRVEKVARHFDEAGRLIRWPSRASHQDLALWVIWAGLPAGLTLDHRQMTERLNALHAFGDHALIRRALVDSGRLDRTRDGRTYQRLERAPPADLEPLLASIAAKAGPGREPVSA